MSYSAIILCAGKGTRMNDNSKNKVAFDCAGVPVIRRIVNNMREGGVERFVIVVGHKAQSVMNALDGIPGVVYVYQSEQKGTGHAALCGLNALHPDKDEKVIISMGDKIISSRTIHDIVELGRTAPAVWSVQPIADNPNGGRVVTKDGRLYGVVEFADAALMTLRGVPKEERFDRLKSLGLNEKKAKSVLKLAADMELPQTKQLCGEDFSPWEILQSAYANAGLYCFDVPAAIQAISKCTSGNAQGELYLTDTLEYFAERNEVVAYEVKSREDMLTFSTKSELRKMSMSFLHTASELKECILNGTYDEQLVRIYGSADEAQKQRYADVLSRFISVYGDQKVVLTRSPGRINLMGRHIDHRGGSINVIATNSDTLFVAAPRNDDTVRVTNLDPAYISGGFSIGESLALSKCEDWLDYLESEPVKAALQQTRGDWINYVKAAALRFRQNSMEKICGMDVVISGNIPPAAGLSSSSSIVVATAEAIVALNSMNLTERQFIDLCGEGEWFVGSRGGAGDHAAMKCSKRNGITHLRFKPFDVCGTVGFSDEYVIIGIDSGTKANKSMGSRDQFNSKVATYEIAFMLVKSAFPEYELQVFRDLAALPAEDIYKILLGLPEQATREELLEMLPSSKGRLQELFGTHNGIETYDLRGVALYGISECLRAERCMDILESDNYAEFGEMMKISHDGDRLDGMDVSESVIRAHMEAQTDLAKLPGAYACSTALIDELCDLLNASEGVLGSSLVGAGLGGCVIALCKKEMADGIIEKINSQYYDKYNFPHKARVYRASSGSTVLF